MGYDDKMKTYSVDRIEGNYAVLIGSSGSEDVALERFGGRQPSGGEVYIFDGENFIYSEELTVSRRGKNARRTRALFDN